METKRCTGCRVDKPLTEFHKQTRKKDGLASRCKACCAKYGKKPEVRNQKSRMDKWVDHTFNSLHLDDSDY